MQTEESQRDTGRCPAGLYVVGIGPGSYNHMSRRAAAVLSAADCVAGYSTYVELVRPLIEGKEIIATAMKKEIERVEAAIERARAGKVCALISSGDPGIYAMAGLVLELCKTQSITAAPMAAYPDCDDPGKTLFIEIVPGIPALAAGASLLGAPLTHDFAAISLSDLLTPWEVIEKRIEAAAMADFVIVIYNPKSKRRSGHLSRAREIILKYRSPQTPVGIVVSAMRPQQEVRVLPLEALDQAEVNMQTTVFVGNSASTSYGDFMFTPRGYSGKYDLTQ